MGSLKYWNSLYFWFLERGTDSNKKLKNRIQWNRPKRVNSFDSRSQFCCPSPWDNGYNESRKIKAFEDIRNDRIRFKSPFRRGNAPWKWLKMDILCRLGIEFWTGASLFDRGIDNKRVRKVDSQKNYTSQAWPMTFFF